ncbi:hypothetical protein BVRB_6g148120 [Beta vulgaris subsp. vulgaris]|nr:hypothetical protein BVRB_6g148120 [Beta vulgaris subsp. vulgaris]
MVFQRNELEWGEYVSSRRFYTRGLLEVFARYTS